MSGSGNNVGGLAGDGINANITNSYAVSGSVSGANNVGGLAGDGNNVYIINSYVVSGSVNGSGDNVGGLAGNGINATIERSYAVSGSVNGSGNNVGGLVGLRDDSTQVTDSYWDSDTSDILAGSDGEPQTSAALRTPDSAMGIYANWARAEACGWDFGSVSDYPALLCLPASLGEQRSFYSVSGGEVTIRLPE